MAKKFFCVCAGLLCLMVAYHLGARNAGAQAGGPSFMIGTWERGAFVAFPNGDIFAENATYTEWDAGVNIFGGNPAGRTIVAFDGNEAVASSGEVFWSSTPAGPWQNLGTPPSGPTPAVRSTIGQLKVRYR